MTDIGNGTAQAAAVQGSDSPTAWCCGSILPAGGICPTCGKGKPIPHGSGNSMLKAVGIWLLIMAAVIGYMRWTKRHDVKASARGGIQGSAS